MVTRTQLRAPGARSEITLVRQFDRRIHSKVNKILALTVHFGSRKVFAYLSYTLTLSASSALVFPPNFILSHFHRQTDYFWTPEVLGKQVNLLRLNDAHEDEEEVEEEEDEVEEGGHGLSAANMTIALPPAPALIPGEDLDTEGSDLLNLISTSLDRFNALLHTESACAVSASMPPDQQQGRQPQDCGIPIPVAYSQVASHMNTALENFSNSVMRTWTTIPECPPHSVSPSSFFPGLVSSQHTTQLLSKESLAAAATTVAAATSAFGKTPKILCSPPGLPRLAAASNHLFEMASSNDSNSTRSHLDNATACIAVAAAATAERKRSSNTCSSLSETSLWDSQWGQFPSEPKVFVDPTRQLHRQIVPRAPGIRLVNPSVLLDSVRGSHLLYEVSVANLGSAPVEANPRPCLTQFAKTVAFGSWSPSLEE
ncbi:hypothetical protein SprV_0301004000 [Sparganum proliferum]